MRSGSSLRHPPPAPRRVPPRPQAVALTEDPPGTLPPERLIQGGQTVMPSPATRGAGHPGRFLSRRLNRDRNNPVVGLGSLTEGEIIAPPPVVAEPDQGGTPPSTTARIGGPLTRAASVSAQGGT